MNSKISTELIVVIVAIVIFYLRVAMLRGQKKRYERDLALKRRKVKGRSKGSPLPQQPKGTPPFTVRSWVLVVISMLLMLAGVVAYNKFYFLGMQLVPDTAFVEAYAKYWYILVSAGVILLAFTVTIRKPIEDSVE
jgi:hypothetical protein